MGAVQATVSPQLELAGPHSKPFIGSGDGGQPPMQAAAAVAARTALPATPAYLGSGGDAGPQLCRRQHCLLAGPQAGQAPQHIIFAGVIAEAQQQQPGAQPGHLKRAGQGGWQL